MLTRREQIIKWSVYGAAVLALTLLFELTLRDVTLLGAGLFLPPLVVGVMASLEGARAGMIFALVYGALCDLTTAGAFPCVYTLAFTLAALLCAMLAKSVLQPGILCSLAASALTFLVLDALQMLALALAHRAAFGAMLSLTARETLVSCPMLAAVHPVLSHLHRRFTL